MFYSILCLTVLLCKLQDVSGAAYVPGTASITFAASTTKKTSLAAYNNLLVLGVAKDNKVYLAKYNYGATNDFEVSFNAGPTGEPLFGVWDNDKTDRKGITFSGLGHATAIADLNNFFVSAVGDALKKTGRVLVFQGNTTQFDNTQILIPYDKKHPMDSDSQFGEALSAQGDVLGVGCQLCNSSAPIYSGGVYVYKPTKSGRWSESQVLTADGVLFLGERVAVHNKVLIAAGNDESRQAAVNHAVKAVADTVVVYVESPGPEGKFEQRQILTTNMGTPELISSLAVFDETIAITTIGSDTALDSGTQPEKVYIFYPQNDRYGLKPDGKPRPQQWTQTQVLSLSGYPRYIAGNGPNVQISQNNLQYLTLNSGGTYDSSLTIARSCMSCKFAAPVAANVSPLDSTAKDVSRALASDDGAFYAFGVSDDSTFGKPMFNSLNFLTKCLSIRLLDEFNDGWWTASLVVDGPDGVQDAFTSQCNTDRDQLFKYCPKSQSGGKYHIHIHRDGAPFDWELRYHVYVGGTWYYGDKDTHMDFEWDDKFNEFTAGAMKNLLPPFKTCEVCSPTKPEGKHRSLSNLRSLHHKGKTSSPTYSAHPTITHIGNSNGDFWNQFRMQSTGNEAWFTPTESEGLAFRISDRDGKHLITSGTACHYASDTLCWVDLPDGEYTMRVGGFSTNTGNDKAWTFCSATHPQKLVETNTLYEQQMQFTIKDQECYASRMLSSPLQVCQRERNFDTGIYGFLEVSVLLTGSAVSLSRSMKSTLEMATSESISASVGASPASFKFGSVTPVDGGLLVSMTLGFDSIREQDALDSLITNPSSASSLLKYELVSMSSTFLSGDVSSADIKSIEYGTQKDFSKVDESTFKTVTDEVWMIPSTSGESVSFLDTYGEYMAITGYAVAAVASVLAVSMLIKRAFPSEAVDVVEE